MKKLAILLVGLLPVLALATGADLSTVSKDTSANWLLWAFAWGVVFAGLYFRPPLAVAIFVVPLFFILVMMSNTGIVGGILAGVVAVAANLFISKRKQRESAEATAEPHLGAEKAP